MSRIRREKYRRQLDQSLGLIPDLDLFLLCWAVHALQTGRETQVRSRFRYPQAAVVEDLSKSYSIYPWLIETLMNECLVIRKDKRGRRLHDIMNFDVFANLRNILINLENAEDRIMLDRINVLDSIHLLSNRQFEWQRGVWTRPYLYRSAFLYGGDITKQYFLSSKGISLDEFSLATFMLRGIFLEQPGVNRNISLKEFGITNEVFEIVISLVSVPSLKARHQNSYLRAGPGHTAYKRSLFRTHPCIEFDGGLIVCPLPDLITRRGTTGIFYDVIDGPEQVKNEIATRFEHYCRDLLSETLQDCLVLGDRFYNVTKGARFATPDVLVHHQNELRVIIECKATRMSYEAKFSEDPILADPRGYGELARGVFQIWRFASHIRRGFISDERLAPSTCGIVVTLDSWMLMSRNLLVHVLDHAAQIALERDPEIVEEDRIPVTFCSIDELESTMATATSASFLTAAQEATSEQYQGWLFSLVHEKVPDRALEQNDYPFSNRIYEVYPWWNTFDDDD